MEPAEYGYLLFRAHTVRRYVEEAAARGELFFASDVYEPLACGVSALARIEDGPGGGLPRLVLRLRWPTGTAGRATADACAARFFATPYEAGEPSAGPGYDERTYVSPTVPPNVFAR